MTLRTCAWEAELTQAMRCGYWPDACGPELRAHVAACSGCADLALVKESLQRARNASQLRALPVSAGLLWWRAELRRRNEAAQRISQPITIAQIFAWSLSLILALVFLASQHRYGVRGGTWWSDLTGSHLWHFRSLASSGLQWSFSFLIPGMGLLVLVSGIALYLIGERE